MVNITYSNISLMTLKVAVVLMSLGLCTAQPILNKSNNNDDQSKEDLLSDAAPAVARVKKEQNSGSTKTSSALIQLVVDNDEARRKYFERREQVLHDSRNGANGHWVKGKDELTEADASAVPELKEDAAPVATPQNLLALLKKRPSLRGAKFAVQRATRQVFHPGFHATHPVAGFPHPATFPPAHVIQPQPHPEAAAPLVLPTTTAAPVTVAAAAGDVEPSIQKARDDYRKNRFAGGNAAYLLALKLSKAGNAPVSDGGSYSG